MKHAYHALSIDDDRKWFHPTIWDSFNKKWQKVEQVWFSGSHTDVGGGFRESGLSDIVLEWMVQKTVPHGLKLHLKSRRYSNFCIAPDATDKGHPPREGAGKVYPGKQRMWPKSAQKTFGTPTIHASVLERAARVKGYQPWILQEFPKHKVEPWVEKFDYQNKRKVESISIRDYDEGWWEKKFKFLGDEPKLINKRNDGDAVLERGTRSEGRLKRDLKRWMKKSEK